MPTQPNKSRIGYILRAAAFLAVFLSLLAAYLAPIYRGEAHMVGAPFDEAQYRRIGHPYPAYLYPSLLLALLAVSLLPVILSTDKLPNRTAAALWTVSNLSTYLLILLAILYAVWISVTPWF